MDIGVMGGGGIRSIRPLPTNHTQEVTGEREMVSVTGLAVVT